MKHWLYSGASSITSVNGHVLIVYERSIRAKLSLASIKANLIPIQFRGPAPNGNHAIGWRLVDSSGENLYPTKGKRVNFTFRNEKFSSHLSGLNCFTSVPQMVWSLCIVHTSTEIVDPASMVISPTVHACRHCRASTLTKIKQISLRKVLVKTVYLRLRLGNWIQSQSFWDNIVQVRCSDDRFHSSNLWKKNVTKPVTRNNFCI